MTNNNTSFNVLIQVKSQNEAERIIGLFRGAGMTARVHRVTSEQDFNEHINDQAWDLLVADNQHPEASLTTSLKTIANAGLHLPTILLSDDTSAEFIEQAHKLGIADVIDNASDGRFLHAAQREMSNVSALRQFSGLQDEYNELKTRAEQLLSESDDAIAYISDGIIMQANDNFAETFAFDDIDDLDCASIIDLVNSDDHARFKSFIKLAGNEEAENSQLQFTAVKNNGENFDAFLSIEATTLEGEPCTQLSISSSASNGSGDGSGTLDSATDLRNRYYLHDQLSSAALQASNGSMQASLLLYRIDNSDNLLGDIQLSGIDQMVRDMATHISAATAAGDTIARMGSDAVAVIMQRNSDKALETAKETLSAIEQQILELDGRTIQYTCTCAVLSLSSKDANYLIDQSFAGIYDIRLGKAKNHAAIHTLAAPKAANVSSDDLSNIDEALESGSFKLLFQPIMSLQGDAYENYEATVVLANDDKQNYPEEIINTANNSKLDRWIILEATKALAIHRTDGHNTRLIINLTANALKDESLIPWVSVATKAANLTEDSVVFQFREEDIRNNLKAAITALKALKDGNHLVSVGNFGKEPEPFKLTSHIKLDIIKFDSRFTQSITTGDTEALQGLINLAKENEIKTILPEVMNAGALATLWQLGTHFIQGAYLQLPSDEMNYEFTEIA